MCSSTVGEDSRVENHSGCSVDTWETTEQNIGKIWVRSEKSFVLGRVILGAMESVDVHRHGLHLVELHPALKWFDVGILEWWVMCHSIVILILVCFYLWSLQGLGQESMWRRGFHTLNTLGWDRHRSFPLT